MPTTSSITSSIRKPFTANKRLLGILTVAFVVIGLFFALYYSHIKNNQHHFRESKLQSLGSYFDIISKQLTNDFQKYSSIETEPYYATIKRGKVSPAQDTIAVMLVKNKNPMPNRLSPDQIQDSVWKRLDERKDFPLFKHEFDEYIVIFKDRLNDKTIETSSLAGRIILPDTLDKSNPFNIGVSMGIPKDDEKYQLFSREYKYETDLDSEVNYDITIIGLVETERYQESIRKIDPWIIALLITFLLLALFGLPYFKMLFIAEDERLSSKDVILAGISVIVGTPIILIVFLSGMNNYYDYYHEVPDKLHGLSDTIRNRFEKENLENVTKLNDISLRYEDSINIPDVTQYSEISNADASFIKNFKFITKINRKGEALYHIGLIKNYDIKKTKNLSTRPYYKDFIDSANVWIGANNIRYVMRPVVSIEGQTEEAVYILNSESDSLSNYRVGASQLKSIHNPILPFGYEFVVVDDSGEVWFHSEEGRATLENFFEVSRQVNDIKAAVLGRIDARGLVNYRDESKLFNVMPIQGTNLSVITLYDLALLRTRVSEVLTLAFVSVVLAIVLMLLMTILSLIMRNPKLGLYKYDRFLFEFLTPKKDDRDTYILLSCLFLSILLIAVIMGFLLTIAPTKVYILCLLMAMWPYLIIYYTLHPYRNNPDIKFRVRDILLVVIIIFLNVLMFKINPQTPVFLLVAILIQISCACIIIYNQLSEKIKKRIRYRRQLSLLAKKIKSICEFNKFKVHIAYRYWYSIFLFSWLLVAAVFPTYLVFSKSKYLNDKFWSKTDQIHIARKYMAKEKALAEKLRPFDGLKSKYDKLYQKHLEDGLHSVYNDSVRTVTGKDTVKDEVNNTIFEEFLWNTRPIYDERVSEFQALVYRHARDTSWISTIESDTLTLKYLDKAGAIQITRHGTTETKECNLGYLALKVSGMLLILAILFSLILFFVDRFFAFRFRHLRPNDFDTNKEKNYIKKFGQILLDERSNSGLLLIGLPFSGKRVFAKEILKTAGYTKDATLSMLRLDNVDTNADISDTLKVLAGFDLKNEDGFNWEEHEVFIIEHLEHNIKSFDANHTKLKVISFLISKKKRVVLISEVYPSQIFAFYEKPPEEHNLPWGSFEDDFNSWRNILSAFPQILIGITSNRKKVYRILGITQTDNPTKFERTIAPLIEELGHSKFLPTLAPIILAKTLYTTENPDDNDQQLDRQRMVMHTQNLGHGYYNDIWNALPTRERYLLYDLAKDGFLNIKNRNSLFSLMKKGLVVWKDRPAIFNYSFKNFIITSVSLNEALRLENKNRGKGSWGNTRILFYLLILTTITFIVMGKPELLKDFEALIGTLGGLGVVIPLVSKLLASGGNK